MTAELISRTGRVQSWLDNPESRLPVSCTVFVVEDSMEGKMESKQAGDSSHMPYDMEQELLSIYQSSEPEEVKTEKVLQLLALYHSVKSTRR